MEVDIYFHGSLILLPPWKSVPYVQSEPLLSSERERGSPVLGLDCRRCNSCRPISLFVVLWLSSHGEVVKMLMTPFLKAQRTQHQLYWPVFLIWQPERRNTPATHNRHYRTTVGASSQGIVYFSSAHTRKLPLLSPEILLVSYHVMFPFFALVHLVESPDHAAQSFSLHHRVPDGSTTMWHSVIIDQQCDRYWYAAIMLLICEVPTHIHTQQNKTQPKTILGPPTMTWYETWRKIQFR